MPGFRVNPSLSACGRPASGTRRIGPANNMPLYLGPVTAIGCLAIERDIALARAGADCIDAVARQHRAAPQQAAVLPVGKAQLWPVQRVLAVDPAGKAVA